MTEAGSRELALPLPQRRYAFLAGQADAVYALTDGIVQRLDENGWHATASLPDGSEPCVFAATEEVLVVGRMGGEILTRPMPQP